MRETLSHTENTGDFFDIPRFVSEGRKTTHAIRAELSGAFQRWEIQMLSLQECSDNLENEFELLKQHLSSSPKKLETEIDPIPKLNADTFTTEEHRSFLDRCLRSMRGDSKS